MTIPTNSEHQNRIADLIRFVDIHPLLHKILKDVVVTFTKSDYYSRISIYTYQLYECLLRVPYY
jgi:hypothetical protein